MTYSGRRGCEPSIEFPRLAHGWLSVMPGCSQSGARLHATDLQQRPRPASVHTAREAATDQIRSPSCGSTAPQPRAGLAKRGSGRSRPGLPMPRQVETREVRGTRAQTPADVPRLIGLFVRLPSLAPRRLSARAAVTRPPQSAHGRGTRAEGRGIEVHAGTSLDKRRRGDARRRGAFVGEGDV